MSSRILIVDDEPSILATMAPLLRARGYEVSTATSGYAALDAVDRQPPQLVILDLGLPDLDGVEVCRRLREGRAIPILVLSARGAEHDKVAALDAGADDYVTKPFNINELLARVRAALRRATAREQPESQLIEIGDFRIDLATRIVTVKSRDVHLTPKEFDLLVYLARHPAKVVTHRTLLAAVWGENSVEQPEYLRVFVGHLRKKLEVNESAPRYIVTEPWVGYRFEPGD
jgi:two-component system KDP operon response regulator KdpE